MWLTGRLAPDHKTIADFRKDNGTAIRKVCARFVALCRTMGLLTQASVAIDGSKFKAVNNRDKNSRAPRWSGAWRRSRRVSRGICSSSTAPTARAVRGAQNQDEPPQREDREAEGADAAS